MVKNKNLYVKKRHWVFLNIFRFIFGPFFRSYYRFSAPSIKIKQGGPYLILANHTAEFDIIFMDMLFDAPLYFVASDQLLNSGKGSWFLKTFFNPIPKSKSMADLAVVKRMKRVIEEGGHVAIFPEGNASIHGDPVSIPNGIGRLIKFLNIPVMMMNIHGLYLSAPRWAYYRKYGRSTIRQKHILKPKDYQHMNADELEKMVQENLAVSCYEAPFKISYQGKKRAEGLHKLIFTCPQCENAFSTYSKDSELRCQTCDLKANYDVYGYVNMHGKAYKLHQLDVDNKKRFLKHLKQNSKLHMQTKVEVSYWRGGQQKRSKFIQANMHLSTVQLRLTFKKYKEQFTFNQIVSAAIQVRTKLIVYLDDGTTLLIRFPKEVSTYAALMMIQYGMFIKGGSNHDSLAHSSLTSVLGL